MTHYIALQLAVTVQAPIYIHELIKTSSKLPQWPCYSVDKTEARQTSFPVAELRVWNQLQTEIKAATAM